MQCGSAPYRRGSSQRRCRSARLHLGASAGDGLILALASDPACRDPSDDASRRADDECVIRYVCCHDGTCPDDRPPSEHETRHDDCAGADSGAVANEDRSERPIGWPLERAVRLDSARDLVVREHNVRPDEDAIFQPGPLVHRRVVLDLDIVTDDHVDTHEAVVPEDATSADAGLRSDLDVRPDLRSVTDDGIRGHVGCWMDEHVAALRCIGHAVTLPVRDDRLDVGTLVAHVATSRRVAHVTSPSIPITHVALNEKVEALVREVIRSGMIAQGPMVSRLESEFAELVGVRHAIAVNNGTTALVGALQALGVGDGDEVITSPFTFVATLNAILEVGAVARFADVSSGDFCIDPARVSDSMSSRTVAIMPVHLYGQCADMAPIALLGEQAGVRVVEDAAQAHGATYHGRAAGSFDIGCFSFYATKNITTGEGGIVTTDDAAVADRLRVLRNQGMRERYEYEVAGHNYRMTDLQAALAIPQLEQYPETLRRRRVNAAALSDRLSGIEGLRVPAEMPGRMHVWHQYTVLLDEDAPVTRNDVIAHLDRAGIGTGIYYPRVVFDYDCYRQHPRVITAPVPVAERISRSCLSLPVHASLRDGDIDRIGDAVESAFQVTARVHR